MRVYSPSLARLPGTDSLRFCRTYFPAETKALTLDGLGGDDVFDVATQGRSPMHLHLYGGAGHDQLRLLGSSRRVHLFDEASDLTAAGAHRPSLPHKKRRAYDRLNDD